MSNTQVSDEGMVMRYVQSKKQWKNLRSSTDLVRHRLSEVDDPARWLGFFSTAIHFQHPVMTAMAIADEAYINDFPENVNSERGQKDMSWLANDRGGALVAPPALGRLRKRKSVPLPRVRSKAVYDAVLRETGSKMAAKKLSEEKTWIDLK